MTHGLFIVFEGGDGAGKSTQVTLLRDALCREGRQVTVTRQPGARRSVSRSATSCSTAST